jgi:hypothetical protein
MAIPFKYVKLKWDFFKKKSFIKALSLFHSPFISGDTGSHMYVQRKGVTVFIYFLELSATALFWFTEKFLTLTPSSN